MRHSPSRSQLPKPARVVLAVGTGKGGVGKSTVALNVALALNETVAPVLRRCDLERPRLSHRWIYRRERHTFIRR